VLSPIQSQSPLQRSNRLHSPPSEELQLPLFKLPMAPRPWDIDPSVVRQADGLSYVSLGWRFECDVFARSNAAAVSPIWGHDPLFSVASFVGFYSTSFEAMPRVVAAVASQRGGGAFLVPAWKGAPPCIAPAPKKSSAGTPVPWVDFLLRHAVLVMDVPADCLSRDSRPILHPFGLLIVVAQFGRNLRFKAKRRSERRLTIKPIQLLRVPPCKLNERPVVVPEVSPLADELAPTPALDSCAASRAPRSGAPAPKAAGLFSPTAHLLSGICLSGPRLYVATLIRA
jgi:hypothetical protein